MLMKNGEHKTDIELHACTELVHVIDTQIDYPSKSKCVGTLGNQLVNITKQVAAPPCLFYMGQPNT